MQATLRCKESGRQNISPSELIIINNCQHTPGLVSGWNTFLYGYLTAPWVWEEISRCLPLRMSISPDFSYCVLLLRWLQKGWRQMLHGGRKGYMSSDLTRSWRPGRRRLRGSVLKAPPEACPSAGRVGPAAVPVAAGLSLYSKARLQKKGTIHLVRFTSGHTLPDGAVLTLERLVQVEKLPPRAGPGWFPLAVCC